MTRNGMSKLSASLMVLVVALSALAFVPNAGKAETPTSKNIYIPVGSSGIAVSDAWVNLTEVHTGNVLAASFSASIYVVTNAPSGYYRVSVVDQNFNYYDQLDAAEIRFDGFTDYTVNPPIELTAFPFKGFTWNVTVKDASSNPIMGATVGFYSPTAKEFVAKTITDASGNAVFNMFGTSVNFDLVVIKSIFSTYIEPITVTSDGWRNITLGKSMRVTGFALDSSGKPANAVAYLINTDPSVPWLTRVLKSLGSFVAFDAYPGTFTLVVDAEGASSYMTTVTVTTGSVAVTIPPLAPQIQRPNWVNITFGTDFNLFALSASTLWSYDDAYPGLLYNDLGSLRAQVDLVLGDGDGVLDASEVGAFYNQVFSYGTEYVSTFSLVDINATVFASAPSITGYVMDLAAGPVTSTSGVHYEYACQYTSHEAIDVGAPSYTSNVTVRYDNSDVNYTYSDALVNGYELVYNKSSSLVAVSGYTAVSINPTTSITGSEETVKMTVEKSQRPIAMASVLPSSGYAYTVYDSSGLNVTEYIVAMNQNVTLSASGSQDPNGNPLKYTWNFGDGSPVEVTRNLTIVHNYTVAQNNTANLTVTDVVGLVNWSDITVLCDGLLPHPVISVLNLTINMTDNSIAVSQRDLVWFNGTSSTDDAITVGDQRGLVGYVQFDWGDGNVSNRIQFTEDQQNVSHAWERSGKYNVTLNVTDVVGHWKNTTMLVKVNDTEAPYVTFVVKNETWGSSLVENRTLYFDANGTRDNVDSLSDLSFSWDFGDGNWFNGTGAQGAWNVTHNYTKTGSFTVKLNVTDLSGNYNVQAKLVTVIPGPRPDLYVDGDIQYEPATFTEGGTGYIIVNVTNKGSTNATNVVLSFYVVTSEGGQRSIGTWSELTLNGTLVYLIEPGQTVQARFPYTPSSKGTYTIRVNVTSDNQLRPFSYTTPNDNQLQVKQAPWKQIALWGGVLAVIVLVPLLLYFRGRWAKRERKGPRREKKEREKEKVSDEEL